ncbi:FCP1-like phosphatase [Stachybotrys elegans]|uniref:RNA polymerase II subunit A C-terminal domain phosphatase n=1 Tax=Stachybotrys elegans TaxID=80388 RepID=A0A8K0SZF3_9HYPO|nr:FCP1-like phosphatase [Stachybotrys elegans]
MYDKVVSLGSRLHYPITVTRLLKKPGDSIKKQETIVEYKFTWRRQLDDDQWTDETTYTEYESPAEGVLKEWRIREGMVINADMPCMTVEEACGHEVQIQGMCTICGADMTETNWASEERDTDRAMINMTHDQTGLMVSASVAQKAEHETQRRLLRQRKLSLVVDLDQTIIHACIEPTIGEWQRDPNNPNHAAVKDVRSFQLDDGPKGFGANGCTYYIKLRPGLADFLDEVSRMYELHVYTMGTRAYAQAIASIVDPEKKLFGNRVISRDENGSITAKSLQRLFPVSTDMVVIIDDRADVWPYNRPNLIKVVPYDFFKGIGDINSSFLPKRQDLAARTLTADEEASLKIQAKEQEKTLEKQLTDRPLLHLQEELDKEGDQVPENASVGQALPIHTRQHVLNDEDEELIALQDHLTDLHTAFYELYDRRRMDRKRAEPTRAPGSTERRKSSVDDGVDLSMVPDVGDILDELKSNVLSGLVIVLSGLVPLGVRVEESEIGLQALTFGAQVLDSVSKRVTHLVVSTARPRTKKVQQAAKIPSIKIVNQNWLLDCLSQWRRLDERPYYLEILDVDRGRSADVTEVVSEDDDAEAEARELKDFDWDTADKDLQEILGLDDEDMDGDESEADTMGFTASESGDEEPSQGLKRKAPATDEEDSEPESALAKKQRVARSRGASSLREVLTPNGDTQSQDEAGGPTNYDNNDDFDEDQLERDLLAELEAAGD